MQRPFLNTGLEKIENKTMPAVSLSFRVHIPYRLKTLIEGSNGFNGEYFDSAAIRHVVDKLADESYLPANKILLALIKAHDGKFKVAFSISGTALELLQEHRPDVIESFKQLVKTGCVELFAETYYNSLSWLHSKKEFLRQVKKHHELMQELFGVEPVVFRNTELIYNNELAKAIAGMGYRGMLCEGLERILQGRNACQVYAAPGNGDFGLLLRHVRLSDDIAFRFDDPTWNEQPLTAEKFAGWLHALEGNACNISLFFDYETFGIYKKKESGIFDFLEHLPAAVFTKDEWKFLAPSDILETCYPKDIYDVPKTISWEDKSKECCVWCENMMQNNTLRKIYSIEQMVMRSGNCADKDTWGRLQSADHFYYMCNDGRAVNDAYRMLNPFCNAEEAFADYESVVMDFEVRLIQKELTEIKNREGPANVPNLYSSIF
jgi:alpha-amylase